MLVTSHKNGTIPGTEKKLPANFKILYMNVTKKYLLHNPYKCSLTIITIISINDNWL